MKKNFVQKIILYVCIIGCITHPIKSMDNYPQLTHKTVIMTGATILCGYLLYKIAQLVGLKYYVSLDSKNKKRPLAPTDPIEISLIDFFDWFNKTDKINQQKYASVINGAAFDAAFNNKENKKKWKKDYQNACQAIQQITQVPFSTIETIIEGYTKLCISSGFLQNAAWVEGKAPITEDFFIQPNHKFMPFVQGIKVPTGSFIFLAIDMVMYVLLCIY